MRSPTLHVRQKIIALLTALTALWIFAAVVTVREGMNLLFVSTFDTKVGRPSETLVDALQHERKVSVSFLSDDKQRQQLDASRVQTDQVLASWRENIAGANLGLIGSDQLQGAVRRASDLFDTLDELRRDIDNRAVERPRAMVLYNAQVEAGFRVYGSVSSLDDQEFTNQAKHLVELSWARELLSQEEAQMSGALLSGTLTPQDIIEFTKLVGAQRFLYANTSADLWPDGRAVYEQYATGQVMKTLRDLEDRVVQWTRAANAALPFTFETWRGAVEPALQAMRDMVIAVLNRLLPQAEPLALGVIVRLLLAGVLGMLAVIAAIVVSITTARALVQQLEKLRDAARELADERLPNVVDRLSQGDEVDVATEAPPLRGFGNDEIGQVGHAFNAVQETAIRAAVQQADLRRGVRDVFLSLARRTQNLVHKQLGMLDSMERRADPEEMEELFRIDHLATRMRRSAENLIVLSGAAPGRLWRRPVPMIDVIRGAIGEVEDYTRVNLLPIDAGALTGRAVGDAIHLLAELIENAVSYSPPYTAVNVSGQAVANGFAVEIEDRGLGMSDADLTRANVGLADPPDFSLADASKLGHYVVAKLAQRHGIKVHLRQSPYGGTTAIVLIPSDLIVKSEEMQPALPAGDRRPSLVAAPSRGNEMRSDSTLPVRSRGGVRIDEARRTSEMPPRRVPGATLTGIDSLDEAPIPKTTPSGLPWRVPQASLAPQLKDDEIADPVEEVSEDIALPDPELIRRRMRSYQHGTERGRSEAASGPEGAPSWPSGNEVDGNASGHVSWEHFGDRQEG